jgi:hypothetical protein
MLTLGNMKMINPFWKRATNLQGKNGQVHTEASRGGLLWILLCLPTLLGSGEAPFDSLIACAQLTPDTTRLACFDREIAELRKSAERSSKSSAATPTPEQKFGFSGAQAHALERRPEQAPLSAVHAQIVSVSEGANGRQIFVLDNSQTWQQIELEPDFSVRNGQSVTIANGVLGSFWLSVDSHRATRVKRIR